METTKGDIANEISKAIAREKRVSKFTSILTLVCLLLGLLWILYSFNEVGKLKAQSVRLRDEIENLENEKGKLEDEKKQLNETIRQIRGLAVSLASITGQRKKAVDMALDLQERNIPYKYGGRKPEDGGFDQSGFLDYILSQPELNIVRDPVNCNQPCLMNRSGITKATTLAELKPGDIIFYEVDHTMMYLGEGRCIGMVYGARIEIKDVHFARIIGYGKVPYQDSGR